MKNIQILFLGGAKRVSFAEYIISEGQKMGICVNVFSYELSNCVPIAVVAKVIIGLKWGEEKIYSDLERVILENDINIVLSFVDPAISITCQLKNSLPSVFIPCSEVDICNVMFDKEKSVEWFEKHLISLPKTYSTQEISLIEYPVILKPRRGSASRGILIIENKEDLIQVENISSFVIQHYIKHNIEYTVDCYISNEGIPLCIVPRVRLEVVGGEVSKTQILRDSRIITQAKRIIAVGGFKGPITIQFIEDIESKDIFVMEINPRLGGGVIASIAAGANIPSFIIREFLGLSVKPIDNWSDKTLMVRYLKEVIFNADNN